MDDFRDDTPNETPKATLNEHKPYVLALVAAIAPLQATVHLLTELCHEIRVARDPIGSNTKERISQAFNQLENVGRTGRTAFGG